MPVNVSGRLALAVDQVVVLHRLHRHGRARNDGPAERLAGGALALRQRRIDRPGDRVDGGCVVVDRRPDEPSAQACCTVVSHTAEDVRVREQPVRDAPVEAVLLGVALRPDHHPVVGVAEVEAGREVPDEVLDQFRVELEPGAEAVEEPRRLVERVDGGVQEVRVRGVDAAFEPLHPVRELVPLGHVDVAFRQSYPFDAGQGRLQLGRAEVGEDDPVRLAARVGGRAHLGGEVAARRFAGHVDAVPVPVVFPAVVDAAQAVLLVATEEEAHAPVGARLGDEADLTARVPERHETFTKRTHAYGRAVGLRQFARQEHRLPEAAEQFAHRPSFAHAGQEFVVLHAQHARMILNQHSRVSRLDI